MDLKLSPRQLAHLRAEPLGDEPNKILMALGLKRMSQQALSDATGIKPPNLSVIVNGHYRRLALDTARRIASAFGACIEDIFPPPCDARKRRRAA